MRPICDLTWASPRLSLNNSYWLVQFIFPYAPGGKFKTKLNMQFTDTQGQALLLLVASRIWPARRLSSTASICSLMTVSTWGPICHSWILKVLGHRHYYRSSWIDYHRWVGQTICWSWCQKASGINTFIGFYVIFLEVLRVILLSFTTRQFDRSMERTSFRLCWTQMILTDISFEASIESMVFSFCKHFCTPCSLLWK